MALHRRSLLAGFAAAATLWIAGCASTLAVDPQVRQTLAPTGALRVAVYPGSPTNMVRKPGSALPVGINYELGRELARTLGVPVRYVEFQRAAQLTEALKNGEADFTFTNASPARAREVDFTEPLVRLELGYLVPGDSPLRSAADIDRPGVRIGVAQGSSSQSALPRILKSATLATVPSMDAAAQQLRNHGFDAFATNKGILYELSDHVPGSRVLEGRWGLEHIAIAVPKGRESALPFLNAFAGRMRSSGELDKMVERAGVRGTARD